jgi:acetyltransferase-like isoleucine patch superfamily enzyme
MLRERWSSLSGAAKGFRIDVTSRVGAALWLRKCTRVGVKPRTYGRPHIENHGRITIGDRVRLSSAWAPLELVTGPGGVIEISDGVFINYGTLISARRRVRIGADVMIGNYAIIADTDIPGIGDPPGAPPAEVSDVEIDDGAWLAARVTVLPGSRIGAGAVIAAGSVVSGEIPPGVVAGGIPARILRTVDDELPTSGGSPE